MCADSLSSQTKCECSTSTSAPSPSTSPLQGHNTTVSCRIIRPGLNSQEAELLLLILTTQKAASANVAAASNCRHRAALLPSPPFISPQHQSMDITTPPKIDGALSHSLLSVYLQDKGNVGCWEQSAVILRPFPVKGEEFYETSPYEPIHFSEEFRHASIISDSSLSKMSPCSEAGKPCNPCLDAAKACNLNETCKRLRSAYNSICSKATPPQPSVANQEPCSRKRCQKALRQFFERVSWELSYPLLFCSCPDQACAERRRRTIVPSCSHQERHKPSCLELRRTCRSDALCRSRLADFHMNCQMTSHTVTSCPHDNYHGCLMSYVGLLGSDVTPNYSDSSPSNITISLWCTCRATGSQEPECEAFHRDFTHNTCLKNAIQSFGYGSEGGTLLVTEPSSTFLPPAQPPIISKPAPSLHGNAIKPMDSACMFSTCANLQDGGQKCVPSDEFECEEVSSSDPTHTSQNFRQLPAFITSTHTHTHTHTYRKPT
ncbi:GDNF family receptor alpha-2-like [Sparus aurata]|uniref:GDNF family receptor alpha-2-like n=1 Tax=Sparus aurata TaxID=8175 RepID=UPI0011C19B63|nr:GDNF family receptor alpha-2-like [Sparus aurata]